MLFIWRREERLTEAQRRDLRGYCHDFILELATGFGLLDIHGEDKDILEVVKSVYSITLGCCCWGDGTSFPQPDSKTVLRIKSYLCLNMQKRGKQSTLVKLLLKLLEGMPYRASLRVLNLVGVYKPILLRQFGDLLPNLRYLGLRWTILNSLPESVARLKTIDLKPTNVTKITGLILCLKYLLHLYLNKLSFDYYILSENLGSNMETIWELLVSQSNTLIAFGKFQGLKMLGLTCHFSDLGEVTEKISTLMMLESLRLRLRDLLGKPANVELCITAIFIQLLGSINVN